MRCDFSLVLTPHFNQKRRGRERERSNVEFLDDLKQYYEGFRESKLVSCVQRHGRNLKSISLAAGTLFYALRDLCDRTFFRRNTLTMHWKKGLIRLDWEGQTQVPSSQFFPATISTTILFLLVILIPFWRRLLMLTACNGTDVAQVGSWHPIWDEA
jgi:hypothetical protein